MTLADKKAALRIQIRELQQDSVNQGADIDDGDGDGDGGGGGGGRLKTERTRRRRLLAVLGHALHLYEHSLTLQCPRETCHAEVATAHTASVTIAI